MLFDSLDVGHVGHRAAGIQVGEQHLLVGLGEDVGRFGHEVHAAKDDEVGLRASAAMRDRPKESPRTSAQAMTSSRGSVPK